ncbi:MAG: M48 family metallopeptidase [Nitrospiraceae bacterium]
MDAVVTRVGANDTVERRGGRPRRSLMRHRGIAGCGLALACMTLLVGCSKNPYTGRNQILMVSSEQEMALGAEAYQQVKTDPKNKMSSDPREIEPVQRVAARVIEAAKRSKYTELANEFQWEVSVIKDEQTLNAFALPGGKIAVYTGIFPAAKNEAGLAAIMGHEVVHALARHGGERMSQNVVTQGLLTGAGAALSIGGMNPAAAQATMGVLGAGAQYGVLLPFSRKHESEADYIGLLLAADAGYDPREAVHVWERMGQLSGGGAPPEFMSTHPGHETRIAQMQKWMPEALSKVRPGGPGIGTELPPIARR